MGRDNLVWPGGAEAALTITFDDGFSETLENTSRWLHERRLRASYFTISEVVGGCFEGIPAASWEALRQADRLGHEIGCHGASHIPLGGIGSDARRLVQGVISAPDRMRFLRQTFNTAVKLYSSQGAAGRPRLDLEEETAGAKGETEHRLGGSPIESFAYPAGRYNQAAQGALVSAGFRSGRSLDPGINGKYPDRYALKAISLVGGMRLQDIHPWIETAIRHKGWLILVFHLVSPVTTNGYPYTCPLGDFQELVCDLQAGPFWIAPQKDVTRYLLEQPQ